MTDTDFVVPARKRDRFSTCYYVKEGTLNIFDDVKNSVYYQPPCWNRAAAVWWARRKIICASAACC